MTSRSLLFLTGRGILSGGLFAHKHLEKPCCICKADLPEVVPLDFYAPMLALLVV